MKPEYAGYWLLPALRSMSTDGTTASSNWYYYVADSAQATPTQMQLPKIKLDAPQTNQNAFTTVDSKQPCSCSALTVRRHGRPQAQRRIFLALQWNGTP